ncbi:hypothetical protein PGT21_018114 [Puccinia graminis f. sp. tritici]|uniref:Uncharacterized protein n=1 Tax=Puccinia graminis f. sp. tritici TaxID=56615 RepID=A0A5B0QFQ0_PUCGR|nr:hypothetical protein PGT21_018114 [Puccinia graminis f. sp. tritici]
MNPGRRPAQHLGGNRPTNPPVVAPGSFQAWYPIVTPPGYQRGYQPVALPYAPPPFNSVGTQPNRRPDLYRPDNQQRATTQTQRAPTHTLANSADVGDAPVPSNFYQPPEGYEQSEHPSPPQEPLARMIEIGVFDEGLEILII